MDPQKKILDVTCGSRSIWFNKTHPAAEVWKAIGEKPLFGHHRGKKSQTFWGCFMKLEQEDPNDAE